MSPLDPQTRARWLRADMRQRACCTFDRLDAIDGALVGTARGIDDPQANYALVIDPPPPEGWRRLLAEASRALARRGRPPVIAAVDAPAAVLRGLGWRPTPAYVWHRVPLDGPAPASAVEIAPVDGPSDRRAFLAIYAEVFAPEPADRGWLAGMARALDGPGALRWTHALARVHGEPVGIATLAHDEVTAGLHALAVRPGQRGRGVGRQLTAWRAAQAVEAGCAEAFLQTEEADVTAWQARAGLAPVFETTFWIGPR